MTSETFLVSACRWGSKNLFGKGDAAYVEYVGLCTIPVAEGRSKCTVMHLGRGGDIFQNIICCRAIMGALGCGRAGGGCRSVVLPESPWSA